jgi:hypothetical protein
VGLLEWWWQPEEQSSWPLWSRENSWTADIFISYVFAQLHRWALKLYNKSQAFQCTYQTLSVILLKIFRITRSSSMLVTIGAVCFNIIFYLQLWKNEIFWKREEIVILNSKLYFQFFFSAKDPTWLLKVHISSFMNKT